ncbi:MAG: 2TM domain-containing protein [Bacteroidetes bacterium]|nr:2TM domain-containing protein [Bacteroidota bacterium]
MFNKKLYQSTRRLVNKLNYFLVHIVTYLIVNIALILLIFSNFNVLWWVLIPITLWSISLVYHGIVIYKAR